MKSLNVPMINHKTEPLTASTMYRGKLKIIILLDLQFSESVHE